ncbi:hypothetical protein GCM10022408_18060 [Hymenobacter fastidiosus]|uniref:Glycosyltransferase RgtA/B/C/D-like domain-containing protein n=1 Tax=Hymenobacter fastidiosus TaxID=486264 RepID=A0ABP7S509_9BACT
MKIALALGLNIGLLLLLIQWIRRQWHEPETRRWLLPLLGLKVLASAATCYLLTADAAYLHYWAEALSYQFWDKPLDWLQTLVSNEYHYKRGHLVYHGYSNAFFIVKLMSLVRVASNGNLFLSALYPSLFNFVGCWQLVRVFHRVFPTAPRGATIVAWLVWPTVVYWTSGLTKESILVGSGAWLLALVLPWLYGAEKPRLATLIGVLLLAVLHFKIRFFFAVPLFAALSGLAAIRLVQQLGGAQKRWVQAAIFGAVLLAGVAAVSEVSPTFRFNKFSSQLIQIHSDIEDHSFYRPHIKFEDLAPTPESIARNTPKAVISALVRPWLGESAKPFYVVVGLENAVLLFILGVAFVALLQGRSSHLPFALVLALLVYCVALAALMGLSTPNLGTLNRYRSSLLPVVLLLALQNDYAARALRRIGL